MTEVEPYTESQKTLNVNRYATKKTIAQGMLDIALLTANASQLKYVLQTGGKHPFYTLMIALISLSIVLQVTAGMSILYIGTLNINKPKHCNRANFLNNAITAQIFLVSVINIIISAFGIEQVNQYNAEQLRQQEQKIMEASRIVASNRTAMIFDDSKL